MNQPGPTPNDHPAVWDLVIADMRSRGAKGLEAYKTRLQPHNGRNALRDAYEEALDIAVYLRQSIYERVTPWCSLPPTRPGFYWWRRTEELVKTAVVEVVIGAGDLLFKIPGDDDLYEMDFYECEWGPEVEMPQ